LGGTSGEKLPDDIARGQDEKESGEGGEFEHCAEARLPLVENSERGNQRITRGGERSEYRVIRAASQKFDHQSGT
jgi:hypothetical protein